MILMYFKLPEVSEDNWLAVERRQPEFAYV